MQHMQTVQCKLTYAAGCIVHTLLLLHLVLLLNGRLDAHLAAAIIAAAAAAAAAAVWNGLPLTTHSDLAALGILMPVQAVHLHFLVRLL
jgi:hypothetical protein